MSGEDSEYIPTPTRTVQTHIKQCPVRRMISPITVPNQVGFVTVPQLEKFVQSVNTIRGCKTPNCAGALVPVAVKCRGLGGALSVTFACNGCASQWALFDTCAKDQLSTGYTSDISVCVQVAFILAGSTHTTYYKTLQHALGIKAVSMGTQWMHCVRLPSRT